MSSRSIRILTIVGGFFLCLGLLWIGGAMSKRRHPQLDLAVEPKRKLCTLDGGAYSEGANVDTPKGSIQCHDGKWVPVNNP